MGKIEILANVSAVYRATVLLDTHNQVNTVKHEGYNVVNLMQIDLFFKNTREGKKQL